MKAAYLKAPFQFEVKNVDVREAPMYNMPVCFYKPKSVGSADYETLTTEILKRLGIEDSIDNEAALTAELSTELEEQ